MSKVVRSRRRSSSASIASSISTRADQRVEEELDRRVLAPRPAPDADQEVHRQQHDLPEDVEEEEVERAEHAHHAGVEQQEQREVALDRLVDAPRGERCRWNDQQRGQQHHGDADAVDADEVLDVEARDPRRLARRTGSPGVVRSKFTNSQIASSSGGTVAADRDPLDQLVRVARQAQDHHRARAAG